MLMIGVCVVVMMLGYTAMIICGYVIAGTGPSGSRSRGSQRGHHGRSGRRPRASARRNARAHLARIPPRAGRRPDRLRRHGHRHRVDPGAHTGPAEAGQCHGACRL